MLFMLLYAGYVVDCSLQKRIRPFADKAANYVFSTDTVGPTANNVQRHLTGVCTIWNFVKLFLLYDTYTNGVSAK